MHPNGKLLAWIEPHCGSGVVAAFVGEDALPNPSAGLPGRLPATQICPSSALARQWVQDRAAEFDLPIKWLDRRP
jgi:hypothetical protein